MWQIPCKMTNSSSKPLQTLGKWYQPRNPKKNPKPVQKKNPKTIAHPYTLVLRGRRRRWRRGTLRGRRGTWRGRRGTWRHLLWFGVAGVALGDIYLRFAWHAGVALVALGWLCWRAWTGLVAGDAAAFCVAGAALGDIYFGFAWQAWHLVTIYFGFAWQASHLRHWAGSGGALGPD